MLCVHHRSGQQGLVPAGVARSEPRAPAPPPGSKEEEPGSCGLPECKEGRDQESSRGISGEKKGRGICLTCGSQSGPLGLPHFTKDL